jgi:transcriptional regulator with XRE-family HTH domain
MKITAITKYKHGELYAALQRLGWNQSELARRTGFNVSTIGKIINLVKRPSVKQADAIQKVLAEAGEYFDVLADWPEIFKGLKPGFKRVQTAEIEMDSLLDHPEVLQLPAPNYEEDPHAQALPFAMCKLTNRQHFVLQERFWHKRKTEDIARSLKCSKSNVGQIERRALRELRNTIQMNVGVQDLLRL